MLTFRMDETNFAQGEREGLRIATGAGLKVDFDEFASDGDALGLWHLHNGGCQGEGTGLEDASGGGHDLTNYGAESIEDGYRFVLAEGDYMDAALDGGARMAGTLECWIRNFTSPNTLYRYAATWFESGGSQLAIFLRRSPPTGARIGMYFVDRNGVNRSLFYQPNDGSIEALFDSPKAFHVAVIFCCDPPKNAQIFVNGKRYTGAAWGGTAGFSPTTLRLGRRASGEPDFDFYGVLDEVRVSDVVRYASDFTIQRLVASGIYTSPTFDAVRVQADWLDLVPEQQVPDGCQVAWEVRAADETDAFGYPQALWQAYSGDPSTLPDGRYFQWRATLSASADRTVSPLLASVEAQASEAGYDLYRAIGPGPEALDYNVPFARVGPGVTQTETAALEPDAVHWFGVRPVDVGGVESPVAQCEARLELDESGQRVPDRPAGVLDLDARALPLGAVRLSWRY
ncbi:MAG: LamG-like jellyroll fold domain-containing protein, partial [Phycisphaerae bacterium]